MCQKFTSNLCHIAELYNLIHVSVSDGRPQICRFEPLLIVGRCVKVFIMEEIFWFHLEKH